MKHAVLYVPGLGDHRSRNQALVVKAWRLYDIHTEVVRMDWRLAEPFTTKLQRLLARIDDLHHAGYRVSLVGVSAGASAVINAYAARPKQVHRVICICGKLRHANTVSSGTAQRNPGFWESVQLVDKSLNHLTTLQRNRILSIRPLADGIVPPHDTYIAGAHNRVIPTAGHVVSIAAAITLGSLGIVRFMKQS